MPNGNPKSVGTWRNNLLSQMLFGGVNNLFDDPRTVNDPAKPNESNVDEDRVSAPRLAIAQMLATIGQGLLMGTVGGQPVPNAASNIAGTVAGGAQNALYSRLLQSLISGGNASPF